jgi:hypothetical protein
LSNVYGLCPAQESSAALAHVAGDAACVALVNVQVVRGLEVSIVAVPVAPNCCQVLSGRVYEFMFQSLDSAVKVL